MNQATVRLLQAAVDIVGGEAALAQELNIGDVLMRAYLEERRPLPDFLLLRLVDVVLAHTAAAPPLGGRLPPVPIQVGKEE
jgi:hypothetical protein